MQYTPEPHAETVIRPAALLLALAIHVILAAWVMYSPAVAPLAADRPPGVMMVTLVPVTPRVPSVPAPSLAVAPAASTRHIETPPTPSPSVQNPVRNVKKEPVPVKPPETMTATPEQIKEPSVVPVKARPRRRPVVSAVPAVQPLPPPPMEVMEARKTRKIGEAAILSKAPVQPAPSPPQQNRPVYVPRQDETGQRDAKAADPVEGPARKPDILPDRILDYHQQQKPGYPLMARKRGLEGKVMLKVQVSEKGRILSVKLQQSSGHDLLDKAARKAVRRWRFVPERRNGKLVSATILVPVEFRLSHGS